MKSFVIVVLIILFVSPFAFAQDQARRLVAVLDYVGDDYGNAVRDGKIVSEDEYAEMREFSKRSLGLFGQLKKIDKVDKAKIESDLKTLSKLIANKADPKTVSQLSQNIKKKLIAAYRIATYPRRLPSLASGQQLYRDNCAQCHGEGGKGDGSGRDSMKPPTPPPANFTDSQRIAGLFPFKAFNVATFGVEGTAMASFIALSEEQRWQVSFYVLSLRHSAADAEAGAKLFRLRKIPADFATAATLATTADGELIKKLERYTQNADESKQLLAYLRRGVLEDRKSKTSATAR